MEKAGKSAIKNKKRIKDLLRILKLNIRQAQLSYEHKEYNFEYLKGAGDNIYELETLISHRGVEVMGKPEIKGYNRAQQNQEWQRELRGGG